MENETSTGAPLTEERSPLFELAATASVKIQIKIVREGL